MSNLMCLEVFRVWVNSSLANPGQNWETAVKPVFRGPVGKLEVGDIALNPELEASSAYRNLATIPKWLNQVK